MLKILKSIIIHLTSQFKTDLFFNFKTFFLIFEITLKKKYILHTNTQRKELNASKMDFVHFISSYMFYYYFLSYIYINDKHPILPSS